MISGFPYRVSERLPEKSENYPPKLIDNPRRVRKHGVSLVLLPQSLCMSKFTTSFEL